MTYTVRRHSGRENGRFVLLASTHDMATARRVFDREAHELRQGTVELLHHDAVIARTSAPRLRTRW